VGLHTFHTFDEAVTFANDTDYGLQAGIFTSDLSKALEATERPRSAA
jgi:acyl-CoA reductase-like NAD-dependent aldehyde dehydrogenase